MTPTLSAIHIFPVKSCAPLAVDAASVEPRGLADDRRWIVTDPHGRFMTGRQQPRLTLMRAVPHGDAVMLSAPGMPAMRLVPSSNSGRIDVSIWKNAITALPAAPEADAWITRWLGIPARFACMDAECTRPVSPEYGQPGDEVSFADGYPMLLVSAAALDALNARLASPVPMLRFRPNLVVANTAAHAEDGWKRIGIAGVEFDVVKPCTRCVFTTVDFQAGVYDPSGEPLRTLTTYRRTPGGVTFGQNLIARGAGEIRVGDAIDVLA